MESMVLVLSPLCPRCVRVWQAVAASGGEEGVVCEELRLGVELVCLLLEHHAHLLAATRFYPPLLQPHGASHTLLSVIRLFVLRLGHVFLDCVSHVDSCSPPR